MHIFHLLIGECTITLEDVALHLGIRVDGRPITSVTYNDWEEICEQYLSVVPPKGEAIVGFSIKLRWLQDNMSPLLDVLLINSMSSLSLCGILESEKLVGANYDE